MSELRWCRADSVAAPTHQQHNRPSRFGAYLLIDGLMAYMVTTSQWGRSTDRIEWAESLTEAKRQYGWTRQLHTSIRVRRATTVDVEASR